MTEKIKSIVDVISELIVKHQLTDEQQEFIRKYSQVRTAKAFEKSAIAKIGSAELKEDWVYDGYRDSGFFGNAQCSLGHKLRYVHFARNTVTDERIRFGIKCVSDFFSLTKEQLLMLSHGVAEVNKEILSALANLDKEQDFKEYVRIGAMFGNFDDCKHLIEKTIREEIQDWRDVMMPLPYRLEKVVNQAYRLMNNGSDFNKYLNNNAEVKELYNKALELLESPDFQTKYKQVAANIKMTIDSMHKHNSLQEWQKEKLVKYLAMDYIRIETLVEGLSMVAGEFKSTDFSASIAKDILGKYTLYGVSEKQMAILEKVYAKYEKKIEELKMENC